VRAQLKCDVEEKSGEEVDIRPMRFFVSDFFFVFWWLRKRKEEQKEEEEKKV
jgi:hypothetical protein